MTLAPLFAFLSSFKWFSKYSETTSARKEERARSYTFYSSLLGEDACGHTFVHQTEKW